YLNGAAEATPTGTGAMGWDGTDVWFLPVAVGGGSVVVSGSVSAAVSGSVAVSGVTGVVEISATGSANSSGNPIYVSAAISSTNISTNVNEWNGTSLGSPTAWGTAPSGNVIGVNA